MDHRLEEFQDSDRASGSTTISLELGRYSPQLSHSLQRPFSPNKNPPHTSWGSLGPLRTGSTSFCAGGVSTPQDAQRDGRAEEGRVFAAIGSWEFCGVRVQGRRCANSRVKAIADLTRWWKLEGKSVHTPYEVDPWADTRGYCVGPCSMDSRWCSKSGSRVRFLIETERTTSVILRRRVNGSTRVLRQHQWLIHDTGLVDEQRRHR